MYLEKMHKRFYTEQLPWTSPAFSSLGVSSFLTLTHPHSICFQEEDGVLRYIMITGAPMW